MQIKKIIIKGLLFMVVVAAVYIAIMFLLVKVTIGGKPVVFRACDAVSWKGGNSYQKFIDFDTKKKYDILVLGSSHAYRGYDPRAFKNNNIDLFNLGTSGQTPLSSYFISKNYINANSCKLVLLDIYDGALSGDGVESTSDLIQNIGSTKAAVEMGLALEDPRAINMLTVRMLIKNASPMYVDSAYVYNGYSEKRDSVKIVDKKWYDFTAKINTKQVRYLIKLISYFKENNIQVIMLTHPAPKEMNRENHKKFAEVVNFIATEYAVEYWDYEFKHNLDSKNDFFDGHHLNQSGVEKYNKMLIDSLKERGYLPLK